MSDHKVLMFNAANMETFPVYPYAFIQVTAVARRENIEVVCQDLLGMPSAEWPGIIKSLQEQHGPAMFLITLRNTDSMNYSDYRQDRQYKDVQKAYFPIEQTKILIETIRALTDKPITVGGFGFSLLAEELMAVLQPDFGVFGGPAAFFQNFMDIIQGNYQKVANLLYFQGEKVVANKRVYFPPSPEIEYTPQAIEEMMAFYDQFPEPGFMGAPVEIMRGCNHRCVFCCEPFVAGRKVQYRDHEVIMSEIKQLVENGITHLYMISSELNPEGNAFILDLADKIQAFNDKQPAAHKVTWFGANYLLKFNREDYRRLSASGFTGGWFDITGLDNKNAQAMRTPYRNVTLVKSLKDYLQFQREEADHSTNDTSNNEEGEVDSTDTVDVDMKVRWTMFLGNPATTMETIRKTITVANLEGLAGSFNTCHIIRPIRVFNYEKPNNETLAVTFSINNELQRVAFQQTKPSFAYPPALLEHLGSEMAIEEMFTHICECYLSTQYLETRDWPAFLGEHTPKVLEKKPHKMTKRLSPEQAQKFVDSFLQKFLSHHTKDLTAIGFPATWSELEQLTPYKLAVLLYNRWESKSAIHESLCQQMSIEIADERWQLVDFFLQSILYRFNVQIIPEYRALFV